MMWTRRGKWRAAAMYVALVALAWFTLAPFAWMLCTSLLPEGSPLPTAGDLLAALRQPHIENYRYVATFPELPVLRFAFNSVVTAVGVVMLQLVLCTTAGYAFARLRFPGRDVLFAVFLLTMMIPSQAMIVPLFVVVRKLGWLNTYAGLIIPFPYLSTAFGTFLLRQFFVTIPRSLDDAACIDGCSHWGVFRHVILPSSRPALATIAAFAFIWTWTEFYWPLLATSSVDMRTLEVGLSVFKHAYGMTNWPLQMTAALIVLIPVLLIFLLLQRYFVRGVVMSGLKA